MADTPTLNPEIKKMFDDVRAQLVEDNRLDRPPSTAVTPRRDIAAFDKRIALFMTNPDAIKRLNDLYDNKLLFGMEVDPLSDGIAHYAWKNKYGEEKPAIAYAPFLFGWSNDVTPITTIFHEVSHGETHYESEAKANSLYASLKTMILETPADVKPDVTSFMIDYLKNQLYYEAKADMDALNTYLSGPHPKNDPIELAGILQSFGRLVDPITGEPLSALRAADGKFKTDPASYSAAATLLMKNGPWNEIYLGYTLTRVCMEAKGRPVTIDTSLLRAAGVTMTFENLMKRVNDFWAGPTNICIVEDKATPGVTAEVTAVGGMTRLTLKKPTGTTELRTWPTTNVIGSSFRAEHVPPAVGIWLSPDGKPISLELSGPDGPRTIDISKLLPEDQKRLTDLLRAGERVPPEGLNVVDPTSGQVTFEGGYLRIKFPKGTRTDKGVRKDKFGRDLYILIDSEGNTVKSIAIEAGVRVTKTYDAQQKVVDTKIEVRLGELINFSNAGGVLGQQLGYLLAGDNKIAGVVASASLQTIGRSLGEVLDKALEGMSVKKAVDGAFKNFGDNFLKNLKSAGIGAVSSFLTAELVHALDIGGMPGELLNTAAGSVINTIITNIVIEGAKTAAEIFNGVGSAATLGTAIGSYIGNKLASQIVTFGSIGGQIGSAVGSILGSIAGAAIGKAVFGSLGTALAGPLGAAIGAFVGTLLGGAIGSLLGGTPRSGADVQWDETGGEFVTANVYSRKGGAEEAARGMATAVAQTFNNILSATGGTLMNPELIQAGNYGTRKADYVYRPASTRDKDAITQRFSGKDAAQRLIGYGLFQGLTDPDFKIVGGDVYVKRALYNTFENGGLDPLNFDASVILGNITFAQRYEAYTQNSLWMNSLISAEPDSVLAAETALTLAKAVELGLTRRHEADWYGGFSYLLQDLDVGAGEISFGFYYDPFADRLGRSINSRGFDLGDSIDVAGQTSIAGTAGADTIRLSSDQLLATSGTTNERLVVDDQAFDGSALTIDVAATIEAGDGDDFVQASDRGDNVLGGGGNDTLYGGRLDDWLLGGEGNDKLYAGNEAGSLGGDGNYLDGGAGNDELYGREGSDWLEGGEGTDALDGGGGDDILAGGAGVNDTLKGGHGDDQYLVRLGDGADTADEVASGTIVDAPAAADQIRARFAAINQPGALRNWAGDGGDFIKADLINALIAKARAANPAAPVAPPALAAVDAGGEDAIVFGQGIGMGDVRMMRVDDGSVRTDAGRNLLIQVMRINPATNMPEPSGTQMLVKDWFVDTLKRVEWLKFADGNEIRIADIRTFIVGGPGDDILNGTDENDFVYGDAGNDYIKLYRGDDIGSGATGDDAIFGDEDDDLLIGGLGEDKLFGGADNDVLTGDGGNDELTGDAGNDLLSGGRGDDVLSGGAGIDTIKFSRGDGRDTILANVAAPGASGGYWEEVWTNTGGEIDREPLPSGGGWGQNVRREKSVDNTTTKVLRWVPVPGTPAQAGSGDDTIEFGLGINIQDIVFTLAGDDLVLAVSQENAELTSAAAAADTITIRAWNGARPISKVAFYQTGIIDVGTGTAGTKIIAGTDGDDTIDGGNTAEWITGGAGGDTLTGNGGDDILNGNNGLDTLFGGAGKDVLYGGSGNDILVGGAEADILIGGTGSDTASYAGSGSVWASLAFSSANTGDAKGDEYSGIEDLTGSTGDDVLIGDSDQNTLDGGTGSDTLRGYEGDDVYIWNGNAGAAGSIPASNIQEGAGFFQEVMSSGGTLNSSYRVQFTVTDQTWISEEGNAPTGPTLDDEVGTPDGRGHYEYTLRKEIIGSNGELVYGMEGLTSLTESPAAAAFGYQDHGWAAGYAPTLEGQQVGFLGLDPTKDSGSDTLELREGIGLADLSFAWSGNDLVITRTGNGSTMTMRDQKLAGGRVEFLQFEDGLTVNLANLVLAANGAAADDFIVGDVARNVMHGNGGHDVVSGGAGNDDLYGDGGDDILEGGEGGDLLDGGANSRQPDNDNSNDATQGESVTWGDTARYAGSKVRVKVDLGPGGVQLEGDAQGDTLINIENVTGSRFGDVLLGNDGGNRINGLDGLNTIKGLGGDDVLVGGADKDWLDGGAGVDDIVGGGGDDDLWGGLGDDRLHGDAGNDWIRGDEGADTLMGGDGRDVLEGGDGDDQLIGGAGELDTLRGGKGNDLLIGEGGADTLEGGEGNDQYYFGASSGQDTVSDASGANTIMFGDNVAFDKLWLTKDGSNLKIAVIGTSDVVMVQGYFLATSSIRSVRTAGHILFLDNADARSMINQMTAKSAATPGAMPVDLAAVLPSNWHAGDKAAPTARTTPLAVELEEDTSKTIAGDYQVVDHDSGGALTYTLSSDAGPLHGTVEIKNAATGEIVYTPDTDFNGTDSFSLVVIDADKQSALIPITVTVTPVDDRPTLQVLNPGAGLISEQTGDWVAQFQIAGGAGATAELEFTINPGGLFKTDGSNVRFVGVPDFETLLKANPGFVVEDGDGDGLDEIVLKGQVRAVAGVNASEPQDFLVRVEDVNEAATGLALGNKAASILERDNLGGTSPSRPAIVLGEVSVADGDIVILPDGRDVSRKTGQHDFKVFENGSTAQSTRFAVIGGELRLLDGKSLDYETDGTAITLRVVATDRSSAPRSIEQLFSFAIVDQVDVFEGDASNNILTGQNGADLIRGLAGNDTLGGGLGNDNLEGGLGNDTLDGGLGADMMAGGAGDDIYMADTGDTVTELNGEGTDLVITALGSYSLALNANVENLKYMGNASFTGTGNDLYNVITGGDGNDTLNGGAGYDVLYGGAGDDTLDGGLGEYDTLVGGTGNDTYVVDSIYDTVTEQQNEGADTVKTAIGSYTLGANVEKLTYTGNASFTGTGNDLNNVITGGGATDTLNGGLGNDTLNGGLGNDTLDGGAGNDRMFGGGGDDIYIVDSVGDTVEDEGRWDGTDLVQTTLSSYSLIGYVENLKYMGNASFTGTGNDLYNVITGGDGNDTLNGGAGYDMLYGGAGDDTLDGGLGEYDTLVGGTGNDTYVVDSIYDTVTEQQNEGADTVKTAIGSYTLGANVEKLTYTGNASFTGTGNDLNNILIGGGATDTLNGGAGNDTLDGGLGADIMAGGAGDDIYMVDTGDTVTELNGEGTDLVETALGSYTLGANVENLTYTGSGNFTGTGNGLNNVMKGGTGADWFYLQTGGNDTVLGGDGIDVALFGASLTSADKVDGGAGTDQIALQGNYATTALTLGADILNVESLGILNGADTRFGDSGANFYSYNITTLDINVAAGVLFTVDAASLRASETLTFNGAAESNGSFRVFGGDGNDAVTGGGGADTLNGRAGNDTLNGGAGNDTLDGGAGADAMTGGVGNDSYIVDDAGDTVNEQANEGTDLVSTTLLVYTLGATLENLTYTGVDTFKGTGNASNNVIVGGAGSDLIYLQTGGVDTVDGGAGNDLFFFVGSLTAADIATGGAGDDDTIILQGNYAAGLALTNNVTGIESISLLAGTNTAFGESGTNRYSYNITTSDTNLGTGQLGLAKINGSSLLAGENLTFNGAAETDIRLLIYGGMGTDTLTGGAKDDVFFFATGGRFAANDKVIGGAGYDGLFLRGDYAVDFNAAGFTGALQGIENITLSSVVDTRYAKELGDGEFDYSIIWNDAHLGAGETITVNGSGGGGLQANEEMFFDGSRETNGILRLFGGAGNDTLVGGAGNDTLNGGAGNDTLFGGAGADTMTGGAGDDVFFVDGASDTVSEVAGEGTDLVKTTSTSYTLGADVENLTYIGTAGSIIGQGNALNNVMTGGAFNDFLMGGDGNDTLYGGLGIDSLVGGLGNDTLVGGEGADTLYGGEGADVFHFVDANVSGVDRIADFVAGTDKIDLSGLDANAAAAGTQTYAFIGTGAFSGSAGQLRYFQSGADTKIQADRNGDGIADFEIVLTGAMALGASSFNGINPGLGPIVFDLAGRGLDEAFAARTVDYDLDGDGGKEKVNWLSAGFAFLALDRNGDGAISSRLEISFTQDKAGAKTDLEGLAAFDTSGDGLFSAADSRFGDFQVWQDHDNDGVSAAGELRSLAETGIVSIKLQPTATGKTLDGTLGNIILNTTSFTRSDGTQGTIGDTVLRPGAESAQGAMSFARQVFGRKSGKYELAAVGGSLSVALKKAAGAIDTRAGQAGAATMLSFRDRQVGMLGPIILDLDGDGLELKKREKAKASFDMDGNGAADDTGWIGKDDGFLVADLDGDGRIGSASELSLLGLKPAARSSIEALGSLDSNLDGRIDANDARFAELRVWRDRNGNGISDQGELASLIDNGILSISLNAQTTAAKVKVGQNIVLATSTFARADGTTATLGDVGLAFKPSPALHASGQPASGIDDPLSALRSGLEQGRPLRWSLVDSLGADGVGFAAEAGSPDNSKSGFAGPVCDLPLSDALSQLAETRDLGPGDAPAWIANPYQDRLAYIVQQMASFGPRPGEGEWKPRASNLPSYDYFAS